MRLRSLAAGCFLLFCLPGLAVAESPAGIAARNELADSRYQTELPNAVTPLPEAPRRDYHFGPLAEILAYLGGAILVGLLLVGIGRALTDWRRDRRVASLRAGESSGASETAKAQGDAEWALGDADRQAGTGDFAAAIHTLLLASIVILKRRLRASLAISATSREILRHTPLPPDNRQAFAGLIASVELCHFGGRPADADLYGRCRRYFHVALGLAESA